MEVKPVKLFDEPKYPLKTELNDTKLKEQIPKRWSSNPAAKIALGTLAVVTLSGCIPTTEVQTLESSAITDGSVITSPSPLLTTPQERIISYVDLPLDLQDVMVDGAPMGKYAICTLNVAPLFLHGDGRGAFGCVMVSPPVFLSEDDALTVINETAIEYGLEFTKEGSPEFSDVLQPVTNVHDPDNKKYTGNTATLKTDFIDGSHNIAIEFVSVEDVKAWSQSPSSEQAIYEEYDTMDAAAQLSEALEGAAQKNPGFYTAGVLYDPCESSHSKPGSADELKAQAKDFFEWLKTQGVI